MNVLWKYTKRNLAVNKIRTFVTILGIVLSVSLFTAVGEGLMSARWYGMEVTGATIGKYDLLVCGADKELYEHIKESENVNDYAILQNEGYADINSMNDSKPYLKLCAMTDSFTDMVAVRMTEGRLPENDTEIILPEHLYTNGSVKYNLSDKLSLEVGTRVHEGYELNETNEYIQGEELRDVERKEYTVVGFYERFNYNVEKYTCPGYTALTVLGKDARAVESLKDNSIIFVQANNVNDATDLDTDISANYPDKMTYIDYNSNRLMLSGYTKDNGLYTIAIGLTGILFALIMVGSVMLIYNSFSISISERIRQFGLLKSIGATKKQIRKTVLFEALYLCVIAVPVGLVVGCVGIGITLYLLRGAFDKLFDYGKAGIYMNLHIEPPILIFIAVLGVITVIISAMIPAAKAIRIEAIDAVKQSDNVKIGKRDVRTLGIFSRIFGFEGMIASKNYRRSRRKYRTTVISLFVSIVLFISASSLSHYMTGSVETVAAESNYDVCYTNYEDMDYTELFDKIKLIDGISDIAMMTEYYMTFDMNRDIASDYYKKLLKDEFDEEDYADDEKVGDEAVDTEARRRNAYDVYRAIITPTFSVKFVSDEYYDRLLKENGISLNNTELPQALLYDDVIGQTDTDDGSRWERSSRLRHNGFPYNVTLKKPVYIEGYYFNGFLPEFDSEGRLRAEKAEYFSNAEEATEEDSIYVDYDKAYETGEVSIAGLLKEKSLGMEYSTSLIFKKSDMDRVLLKDKANDPHDTIWTNIYMKAENHAEVCEKVTDIVNAYYNENNISEGEMGSIIDYHSGNESELALVQIINVFCYGFIILISLIAMANVFNTISTNILLRRREFAMLKSVGMSPRGQAKMMSFECLMYGFKGLLYGIPASIGVSYLIFESIKDGINMPFYVPAASIVIAVGSVFAIVFTTMIYSMNRIRKDNILETLRKESI